MAKTKGHGNPNWARDEVILAFDLYQSLGYVVLPKSDPRIAEFSEFLRGLPYHLSKPRNDRFRNVNGVWFKLQNLRNVLTGVGLARTSAVDREVIEEFRGNDDRLKAAAKRLLASLEDLDATDFSDETAQEEHVFREGAAVFTHHKRRERNRSLRRKLLVRPVLRALCFERHDLDGTIQEAYFEAHHIVPMAEAVGLRQTELSDLALLCACCHRAIHKIISHEKRWFGIKDAKRYLCRR